MAYVRLTLLEPQPGAENELRRLLEELDACLADAPGLLLSLVLSQAKGRLGRISLWLSKEEANHEATSPRILALRSRLLFLSLETEEALLEVESGYLPEGFNTLIWAAKQPAHFPAALNQPALLD